MALRALLCTLMVGCEAYSLLATPRVVTHAMRNTMPHLSVTEQMAPGLENTMPQPELTRDTEPSTVEHMTQRSEKSALSHANDFRYGSDRAVIGFQGGTGKGLGVDRTTKGPSSYDNPAWAFRYGSDRSVIGFQGGTGTGLGDDALAAHGGVKGQTGVNHADTFRYGSDRAIIGYQGGTGMGLGDDKPMGARIKNNNRADAFRYGSGRTSIGFEGGV